MPWPTATSDAVTCGRANLAGDGRQRKTKGRSLYILYGHRFTRSILVEAVLREGGLAYEQRSVDIRKGEHRDAEFLATNPAGFVPALVTPEGEILHETPAIMLYLAERHGLEDLAPRTDDPQRGLFLAKLFYFCDDLQPAMKRSFYAERYSTDPGDTERIRARAREMALERWSVVEAHLAARGPYHLGARFSLVDLCLAYWALCHPPQEIFEPYPAIKRCFDLVLERPVIGPLFRETRAIIAAKP